MAQTTTSNPGTPEVHPRIGLKKASRRQLLWIACAALLHLAAIAMFVRWIEPRPERDAKVVVGVPMLVHFGTARTTDQAIRVGSVVLGCAAHAVAFSYSCPKSFEDGQTAIVTYFEMRTVEARLGLAEPTQVLLSIEQGGSLVYRRSPEDIKAQFLRTGLLVPLSVFGIAFLLFARFILNRRGK